MTALENKPVPDVATLLAVERTRLAADRTLMSWIRTSFSMSTFGFGIMKFFQYLSMNNNAGRVSTTGTNQLGIILIVLGILSLIPGMLEHNKTLKELNAIDKKSRWSYAFFVAILVGIIGIYVLIRAVTRHLF